LSTAPALPSTHSGKQSARQHRQCDHVHIEHCCDSLELARCERAAIAHACIVDQQIDRQALALDPLGKLLHLQGVAEVGGTKMHLQLRIARSEFITQLLEPIRPARDEHHRARPAGKLPRKLGADACRGAGNESSAAVDAHVWINPPATTARSSSTRRRPRSCAQRDLDGSGQAD
jgi:hypothetical protein